MKKTDYLNKIRWTKMKVAVLVSKINKKWRKDNLRLHIDNQAQLVLLK